MGVAVVFGQRTLLNRLGVKFGINVLSDRGRVKFTRLVMIADTLGPALAMVLMSGPRVELAFSLEDMVGNTVKAAEEFH